MKWLGPNLVTPVLHQLLFRDVLSGIAPINSSSNIFRHYRKNMCRVEFDWAPDGSLLSVREFFVCPICGVTFISHRQGHSLCSVKCQNKAWRLEHPKKIPSQPTVCVCCGVVFMPTNYDARFCSESCQQKAWYSKNKARKLKTNAVWRKKNPTKVKKWGDDWRIKNPEKVNQYQHITEIRRKNTAIVCKDGIFRDPGTSLNLSTKLVRGQERVIEMVRLERNIERWKNSPFR